MAKLPFSLAFYCCAFLKVPAPARQLGIYNPWNHPKKLQSELMILLLSFVRKLYFG